MNTALIPVFIGNNSTQLCNARDLHKKLEVETRFNDWIERRIQEYGFVEGEDYLINLSNRSGGKKTKGKQLDYSNLSNQVEGHGGDRRSRDYHLTLDMAKELAMVENNAQGRMVRRYFIQAEAELRQRTINELRDMARHILPLPGVKTRARDGVNLRQMLVLQDQSLWTLRQLIAATEQSEQVHLHIQLRQINEALGRPTQTLEEIIGDRYSLSGGKGE
ncbi:MAG: antA/AntB antirepressor family protein [Nitrosomonadales bacterium]|nr:antA/AntB antirepressor family protein [Nitrosomonadales bacterium]